MSPGLVVRLQRDAGMKQRRLRVLVIDDDEKVRETLSDIIDFLGHQVDVAASGEDGVALFAQTRHDVVVTDLQMPEMTGWDVIDRVRAVNPEVRVVLCTATATNVIVERARTLGIVLLRKPVHIDELRAAVLAGLSGASGLSNGLTEIVRRVAALARLTKLSTRASG